MLDNYYIIVEYEHREPPHGQQVFLFLRIIIVEKLSLYLDFLLKNNP